jgi:serine/threonine protein kinase
MVKSVNRLHEKNIGHMQVWSKKFVIRKSFEVHLFPSGFEAPLDDPSNEIIWEEAQSEKFK